MPPSPPPKTIESIPAIVLIIPLESMVLILFPSPKYNLPLLSIVIDVKELNFACNALPPSPLYPNSPLPAIVVIIPAADTFRITLYTLSVKYKLPFLSTTLEFGFTLAEFAGLFSNGQFLVPISVEIV